MSNAKRNAAKSAINLIPKAGVIGLGSGSTVAVFAEELGNKMSSEALNISVVPSSYQAYQLAVENDIPLTNLDINPELDLTVDGADEVSKKLDLTKGGGGALLQEKIVAAASRQLVIIVDESKLVEQLASKFPIPVEVLPFSLGYVMRKISEMNTKPEIRMAKRKMGPIVTDNGNFILDVRFSEPIRDPAAVAVDLKMIPGVIETGLFVNMTSEVHVGTEDGVYVIKK